MNFLPVVQRELLLLARRRRTYSLRVLSAAVVLLLSLGLLYAGFGGLLSAASAGRNLFWTLSILAGGYVLWDGALRTADCLSEEKRDGTLGLLFLTDLAGYDIVAGKFVARVATAGYCLLAALPALGIALFLGGVSGRDYARMLIALLNGLFFSASVGMLASACCWRERAALSLSLGGVLLWALMVPAAGCLWKIWFGLTAIPTVFLKATPAGAFLDALTGTMASSGDVFGASVAATQALAWGCLGIASWIVPRTLNQSEVVSLVRPELTLVRRNPRNPTVAGFWRRQRRLEQNPLIWAEERPGRRGLGSWPVLLIVMVAWIAARKLGFWKWPILPVYAGAALVAHLALSYFVLLRACRTPAEDRRLGVLEILLTTPIGDDVYLQGRLLALKRQCFWPILFVFGFDLAILSAGLWELGWDWEWLAWIATFGLLFFKLLLDLYSLSWVGFWQGVKTGNTSRALRITIFYVFLVRWIWLLGFIALLGALSQGRIFQSIVGGTVAVVGYILLFLASTVHFCGAARSELQDDLRLLALSLSSERTKPRWSLRDFSRAILSH